jgi:hypothetical protein
MTNRSTALTLSVGIILGLALLAPAAAQTTSKEAAAKTETTDTVKPPETHKEHLALADTYREKAVAYRKDATTHRQMLETYKKRVATPTDAKTVSENPWIKKMRLHCEEYIRDAENLVGSAEKFADFHTMRAAEPQGK